LQALPPLFEGRLVRDVWGRIEAVLRATAPELHARLAPGAAAEDLAAAQSALGWELPDDLRESYTIHDGSGEASVVPHDWRWGTGCPLLSLADAVRDRHMWVSWLDGGSFEGRAASPRGPIRPVWWNRRWLPVTWDGGGDHLCIDLDPAPGGRPGQVIYFSHEEGPMVVVAESWRAYLERYAAALESGNLRFEGGELVAR
jgi:cell wall assembly regulator SMI1